MSQDVGSCDKGFEKVRGVSLYDVENLLLRGKKGEGLGTLRIRRKTDKRIRSIKCFHLNMFLNRKTQSE